jgi:low temperature requirement protein LtrA
VVGPLELFYDLAVVVLVSQAAHRLAGHLSWGGLGQFAAVFTLVWIAWVNGSLHHELHGHEDARARSTFLLQILLLAAMGAFIPQAGGARGAEFAAAAAALFAVLTVLWLLAARGDRPEYRRPSQLYVTGTAACAVLLAGTALLPAGARVLAWGVLDAAYLAGFTVVIIRANLAPAAALVITDALTERFGAFIIIVLGETLTGVVAGLSGQPVSALTLAVGLVAVVVGFGAWWTYFDFAGHHRPRQEPVASMQWILGHLPLTAAIAAMGAAMLSLVDHAHDARTPAGTAWILSAGTAVVLCATVAVSASLDAWRDDWRLYRPLARTCAAVAVACLALGALRPAPLALVLLLVLLLAIPWMLAVARRLGATADLPGSPSAAMDCKLELQVVSEGAGGRMLGGQFGCSRCQKTGSGPSPWWLTPTTWNTGSPRPSPAGRARARRWRTCWQPRVRQASPTCLRTRPGHCGRRRNGAARRSSASARSGSSVTGTGSWNTGCRCGVT